MVLSKSRIERGFWSRYWQLFSFSAVNTLVMVIALSVLKLGDFASLLVLPFSFLGVLLFWGLISAAAFVIGIPIYTLALAVLDDLLSESISFILSGVLAAFIGVIAGYALTLGYSHFDSSLVLSIGLLAAFNTLLVAIVMVMRGGQFG